MKCVLKYPKKENTKRTKNTKKLNSGSILAIVFYFLIALYGGRIACILYTSDAATEYSWLEARGRRARTKGKKEKRTREGV